MRGHHRVRSVLRAGADLNEALQKHTGEETLRYLSNFQDVNTAIEFFPRPVVAAINGYCMTGGLELALACDIRIADATAQFAITSARIGSLAGAGETQRLPRLIGVSNALEMMFLATPISAQKALEIGLINRIAPRGKRSRPATTSRRSCRGSLRLSLAAAKRAVREGDRVGP